MSIQEKIIPLSIRDWPKTKENPRGDIPIRKTLLIAISNPILVAWILSSCILLYGFISIRNNQNLIINEVVSNKKILDDRTSKFSKIDHEIELLTTRVNHSTELKKTVDELRVEIIRLKGIIAEDAKKK